MSELTRGKDKRYSTWAMGDMARVIVVDSDVPEIALYELEAGLEEQKAEAYFHEQSMTELSLRSEERR